MFFGRTKDHEKPKGRNAKSGRPRAAWENGDVREVDINMLDKNIFVVAFRLR
jgi:hypothetical protein